MLNEILGLPAFDNPPELLELSDSLYQKTKMAWGDLPPGDMLHAYSNMVSNYRSYRSIGALDYDTETSKITGINDQPLEGDFLRPFSNGYLVNKTHHSWLSAALKQTIEAPFNLEKNCGYSHLQDRAFVKTPQERAKIALMDIAVKQTLDIIERGHLFNVAKNFNNINTAPDALKKWHANNKGLQQLSDNNHFECCVLNITAGVERLFYFTEDERNLWHQASTQRLMPEIIENLIEFAEISHKRNLPPEQIDDILVWHNARRKAELVKTVHDYKN
jgi:hypothetical protein